MVLISAIQGLCLLTTKTGKLQSKDMIKTAEIDTNIEKFQAAIGVTRILQESDHLPRIVGRRRACSFWGRFCGWCNRTAFLSTFPDCTHLNIICSIEAEVCCFCRLHGLLNFGIVTHDFYGQCCGGSVREHDWRL